MAGAVTAQTSDIQCREYFSKKDAEFDLVVNLDSETIGLPNPYEQATLIDLPIVNVSDEEIMAAGFAGGLISMVLNRRGGGSWVPKPFRCPSCEQDERG